MNQISIDMSLYKLIKKHPDLKKIMYDIGFKEIVKANMLQTVGRMMTLRKGCQSRRIEISDLKKTLETYGYSLLET